LARCEEFGSRVFTLRRGQVQCSLTGVSAGAVVTFHAWICTVTEQQIQHFQMTAISGAVKGCEAIFAPAIHVGAFRNEEAYQLKDDFFAVAGIGNVGGRDRAS
jgi:hypothetical protein